LPLSLYGSLSYEGSFSEAAMNPDFCAL
jgi:hypothetical protein